jgi:hypothetical protein
VIARTCGTTAELIAKATVSDDGMREVDAIKIVTTTSTTTTFMVDADTRMA